MNGAEHRPVKCPRCGYDQRGVIGTWIESCPLDGTCSECGLELNWAEVHHPEKFEPQWCVEFVPRLRSIPRACARTFFHSFWPWRFWWQLKMSQPIHPWRLAAYVAAMFVLVLMCYIPLQAGVAILVRYQLQQTLNAQQAQAPSTIASLQAKIRTGGQSSPQGFSPAQLQQQLVGWQQMQSNPPSISLSYAAAVVEALLYPNRAYSNGVILYPSAKAPYTPPNMLWSAAFNSGMGGWAATGPTWAFTKRASMHWMMFGLAMMLMLPASLILLPVSRRKAKVRWSHIGRIAIYGLFIPLTIVLLCVGLFALDMASRQAATNYAEWVLSIIRVLPCIMLLCWWGAAISRHLKIPHGHFTAFMLMIMCALIFAAALWLIEPRILIRLL